MRTSYRSDAIYVERIAAIYVRPLTGQYSVNDCEEMETIHAIWSHQNPSMGQKRAAVNLGARNDGELKLARTPMKQVKEINPHGRTYSKTRKC